MSPEQAGAEIISKVLVTREDVARAKVWLARCSAGRTTDLCTEWLATQTITLPKVVEIDSPTCSEVLTTTVRGYSIALAFYQAVWELIGNGELLPDHSFSRWEAQLGYKTPHGAGGIRLDRLHCPIPERIERSPFPFDAPRDPDIFLKGIDCAALHAGIHEAVKQALSCFWRGLYMPATAMLAAAAEANWTECGTAVAKNLADSKYQGVMSDPYASISRKVTETRKALETAKGRELLKRAARTIPDVTNAELWTTALRDRRNMLHWTKANSFIVDHSETGILLMAAPLHIGTLEAVRVAC